MKRKNLFEHLVQSTAKRRTVNWKQHKKHMLVLMSIDYVDDYFWLSCWLFLAREEAWKGNLSAGAVQKRRQKRIHSVSIGFQSFEPWRSELFTFSVTGLLCWNPIWLSQLHTAASFTAETNFLVHEFMDFWNQKTLRWKRNPFHVIGKQLWRRKKIVY